MLTERHPILARLEAAGVTAPKERRPLRVVEADIAIAEEILRRLKRERQIIKVVAALEARRHSLIAKAAHREGCRRSWNGPTREARLEIARAIGRKKNPHALPPMTREQNLYYRQMRRAGIERKAALSYALTANESGETVGAP